MSNPSATNPGRAYALLLCGLSLLAGCAVGPNYQRPVIDSPAAFRGETAAANGPSAELAWWQVYKDAILQALIREAFTNNYDLRIAVTRVEQARAVAAQACGDSTPRIVLLAPQYTPVPVTAIITT